MIICWPFSLKSVLSLSQGDLQNDRDLFAYGKPYCYNRKSFVGERPYLTTKIITLSEFFNFVHQVSRL
jgi:hypothetical protein